MSEPPPPPRHVNRVSTTKSSTASSSTIAGKDVGKKTWKDSLKDKGKSWGGVAYEKSWKWSDAIGGRVNDYAGKLGSERFWPVTGDFPEEMEKAGRILRAFTVDGIPTTVTEPVSGTASPHGSITQAPSTSTSAFTAPKGKQRKVLRKIPPEVIAQAKGLCIFTSMRSGIAPFGGAGGTGIVVAKLPDGSWSAPSSISPNNLSSGLLLGLDIYDAVLVIRSQKALETFYTHKATLGTDFAVVAGPFGIGATAEAGIEQAPVFSYIRSRGFYAGISIMGQVFIERFEENGAMYHWPGIKGKDILTGKVAVPREAASLMEALKDAESGRAQRRKGDGLDVMVPEGVSELVLEDGVSPERSGMDYPDFVHYATDQEILKLPPTPTQVEDAYGDGDFEAEKLHFENHATQLSDGLAKAHIYDNPALATTPDHASAAPPLPPRYRGLDLEATDSKELPHLAAAPETYNSVNLNDLDPSEARELQQHLEQQEQERLAAHGQVVAPPSEQPALPSRPPTSLSHTEDVFHDAVPTSEQLPTSVLTTSELPPSSVGAPVAVFAEKTLDEGHDLK